MATMADQDQWHGRPPLKLESRDAPYRITIKIGQNKESADKVRLEAETDGFREVMRWQVTKPGAAALGIGCQKGVASGCDSANNLRFCPLPAMAQQSIGYRTK